MVDSAPITHDSAEPIVHAGIVDQSTVPEAVAEPAVQNKIVHADYNDNQDHADWQSAPPVIVPHIDTPVDNEVKSLFDNAAETVHLSDEVQQETKNEVDLVVDNEISETAKPEAYIDDFNYPTEQSNQVLETAEASAVVQENLAAVDVNIGETPQTQDELFKQLDGAELHYVEYKGEDFMIDPVKETV
jgi:hypothetical protein